MKKSIITATGPLPIPMTNDYLFRALLQQNNKVLKGLVSSLLHLSLKEIIAAEITNPIELGTATDSKTFLLDIKVLLNSNTIINLEMQVINEHNWQDRSLSYLCRSFDNLNKGEKYPKVRPVIQICFLNFTLFPDYPEFYSTYQLLNVKNYIKYSDKLCLHVLDLTCIDLATNEDRQYQIDYWAALFKATTWEEIIMLTEKNESIAEAAETVYKLSQDEMIRLQCEAREDYLLWEWRKQHRMKELVSTNKELATTNKALTNENQQLNMDNKILTEQLNQLTAELEELRKKEKP